MQKKYSNYQPLWIIFLLSLFTLGIYNIIWLFKTRLQIREVVDQKLLIWPLCVPILNIIPIAGIFVKDSDLLQAKTKIEKKGAHNGAKAFVFIIMFLLWIAFFVVGIFSKFDSGSIAGIIITTVVSFFFVVNSQEYLNYYWRDLQKDLPERKRFTKKEYYILGFGLVFCVFVLFAKTIFMSEIEKLSQKSDVAFAAEQYEESLSYVEEMLKIAKEKQDKEEELDSLVSIAYIYETMGDTDKAIKTQEQVLSLSREEKELVYRGDVYGYLGNLYYENEDYENAIRNYEVAIELLKDTDQNKLKRYLANLRHSYKEQGDYFNAIKYSKQLERVQPGGHSTEVTARVYFRSTDYEGAKALNLSLQKYLEAAGAFRAERNYKKEAAMLHQVGLIYYNSNNLQMALENFKFALEVPLEESMKTKIDTGDILIGIEQEGVTDRNSLLFSIGNTLMYGDIGENDCESMFNYIAPNEEGVEFSSIIASCYFFQKDYENSIRWYRKVIQQFEVRPPEYIHIHPSNQLGIIFVMLGDTEQANDFILDNEATLKVLFGLQDSFIDYGNEEEWQTLLFNALQVFDAPSEQIDIYVELGELAESQKDREGAKEYYEKALVIAQDFENERAVEAIEKRISDLGE